MHQFRVIAPKVKIAAPGDILLPIFANRSQFPFALSIVPPVDLTLPVAFRNTSTFPTMRITTGVEPDLTIPQVVNTSTFPTLSISEAPADADLTFTPWTNESTFPGLTVSEAPADGFIGLPTPFVNVSTFGGMTISPDETTDDDSSEGIGTDVIGDII